MSDVFIWWVLLEAIGLAAWPVAYRFFDRLPDRGYAFAKPLGLLLIAYPFWLLTTLGFLDNTRGAIALVAIAIAVVSWLWGRGWKAVLLDQRALADPPAPVELQSDPVQEAHATGNGTGTVEVDPPSESPLDWIKSHISLVLTTELVFTGAFVAWAFVRAYMPDITATEKPMDFAFLNGILQSRRFPPLDPWLSGYAISYYYFGYLILAMLTLLSGVASSVAFNLSLALLFALAAVGAFGLVYDLIQVWKQGGKQKAEIKGFDVGSFFYALLAPVFLLIMGNLEGLFEALHARGLGSSGFWNWLDIKGLVEAPVTGTFAPTDNWWWWRASRVIHDVVAGQTQEVIDEFPQFSFLLGDLHPHVQALPFTLLALAAALSIIRGRGILTRRVRIGGRELPVIDPLLALIIGALGFINSWDLPTFAFIVIAAYALARLIREGRWEKGATRDLVIVVVELAFLSILFYLPFYVGFQSQAGGVLPVLFVKTRLHQYLIMFGFFVLVLGVFVVRALREEQSIHLRRWLSSSIPFLAAVLVFPFLVGALALAVLTVSPALRDTARAAFPNSPDNWVSNVLGAYFGPLLSDPWLFVVLGLLLAGILVLLRVRLIELHNAESSTTFVLLLAFTAFLLTFGLEFVYLRDSFGTRMNSVFKFYFQAWTLFSVAAGFAIFYLAQRLSGAARSVGLAVLVLFIGIGLIYPVEAIPNRADNFDKTPTLDGILWIRDYSPGDYAVIRWLDANAPRGSTILEATGGEYTYGNRISMATGLPTVLGWAGHELQWRGNSRLFKDDALGIDRAADIARIYQTVDPQEALTLLDKYAISFVVVGQTERSQYNLNRSQVDKFGQILGLVFESGDARIYGRTS